MKHLDFDLDERQVTLMFSPLRSKTQVIELLMKTIKHMLVNYKLDNQLIKGKVVLKVSKMSRLFFFSQDKFFSINFPFFVSDANNELSFYSKDGNEVDSKVTSDVLSILASDTVLSSSDVIAFAELVSDISDYNAGFWSLLRELFLFEDGYIRYDYDEKNENGLKHPLYHLDVFYCSGSTFKIGLRHKITDDHLVDFLNLETDCHFLEKV